MKNTGIETNTVDDIGLHLRNIYNEEELDKESTAEDFSVVQKEDFTKR